MSKQMLEPYPLCGRKPHKTLDKKNDDGMQALIIACPTGHVRVACINHDAAVEEWNTRPQCSAASAAQLRRCSYCKTWNSKPCGEQCHWNPTDPTAPPHDEPQSAPTREEIENIKTAILEDTTALNDTLWMPDHIFKGGSVVDYIDAILSRSQAESAK